MAAITASLVKELREQSGAGMMDCKKALTETDGDLDAAIDWLRTKGLAAAQKKAGRVAAEGLVAVAVDGSVGSVVELNSETDFVARNEDFQNLVETIARLGLKSGGDIEALKQATAADGKTVAEMLQNAIATIGENMNLRRYEVISVSEGSIASYVHTAVKPGMGKIGVLVALESSAQAEKVAEIGKQVAMHVAAASPKAANREEIDAADVQRERDILTAQAKESGRPDNIIEKMVEGRLRKFYEESVLVEQAFVIDPDQTVGQALESAGKAAGADIKVKGFVRLGLGEGVEREESDFAAEVAAAAGTS
jgi:elongation factor Ts